MEPILFFDGECGLCQRSVRLLLRLDRRCRLRFAPLRGTTAAARLGDHGPLPDSLVLRSRDGRLLVRSAAVFEALRLVGGPWPPVAWALSLLPRGAADAAYDLVARHRGRLFGRERCEWLPGAWRGRLLP